MITFDTGAKNIRLSSEENHDKSVGDVENTIISDSRVLIFPGQSFEGIT